MARIREYTQQTSVGGEVGGRRATSEDFGFGREMQQFGETVTNVAAYVKEQDTRREVDAAQEAMSQARLDQMEYYDKRKQAHQPGDMTFAETTKREVTDYVRQMADQYKSPAAKHYIRQNGTQMATSLFSDSLNFQSAQAAKYSKSAWETRQSNDYKTAYADPRAYELLKESAWQEMMGGVGSLAHIDPTDRQRLFNEYTEKLAWFSSMKAAEDPMIRAKILGSIGGGMDDQEIAKQVAEMEASGVSAQKIANFMKAAKPSADTEWAGKDGVVAKGEIDTSELPTFLRDLAPQKLAEVVSIAHRYKKQEDGIADKATVSQAQNAIADISVTGQVPYGTNSIDRARLERVSPELNGVLDYYTKNVTQVESLVNMPPDAAAARIEAMNPALDPDIKDPSYNERLKAHAMLVQQYVERRKAIEKDPILADQQSKFAPGIGGVPALTVNDPKKWVEEFAARSTYAKSRSDERKSEFKMFSEPEAKAMNQMISTMDSKQVIDLFGGISQKFEKDPQTANVVMKQLAQNNSALFAVGNIMLRPAASIQNGETRDQAAEYLARGQDLMRKLSGKDAGTEKGVRSAQLPSSDEAFKKFSEMSDYKNVSPEFTMYLPKTMEAVMAHYVGKLVSKGITNMDIKTNSDEFKSSVKTIVGTPQKFGETKVMAPWGMKETEFLEAVRLRVPMQRQSYGLRQPPNAPEGMYEIVQGNVVTGVVNVFSPVPVKEVTPKTEKQVEIEKYQSRTLPGQFINAPTYYERTGRNIYGIGE